MKPVDQTIFGEKGDCFEACLASILEIPLEVIPVFKESDWFRRTNEWLAKRGLFYVEVRFDEDGLDLMQKFMGYHLICGVAERGLHHAVIGYKGVIVHDPHPSRAGIPPEEDKTYGFLIPLWEKGSL
jgi:hypothetical protein